MASFVSDELKNKIIDGIVNYMKNGVNRTPFPDWYETKTGLSYSMKNRTVQGGIFFPLLMNTVSRALRDCKDISKKTKESVRLKAIEMGYLPSTMSKLSYNGKRLIAVATSEFKNLFFATMCSNLFKKIREDPNYEITIVNSNSRVDATVIKNCISQRVDALISLFEFEEEAVELAKVNNIPLVLIGLVSKYDYVFSIRTDDELKSLQII